MTRINLTAAVLSLMLFVGLSAMAEGTVEPTGNPNSDVQLVSADDDTPAVPAKADAGVEQAQSDAIVPIYVPPSRGSTLVQDGSGVTGARRPGVRL